MLNYYTRVLNYYWTDGLGVGAAFRADAVERTRHVYDSRGQILALTFRYTSRNLLIYPGLVGPKVFFIKFQGVDVARGRM
jgi:hypothetical protein